MVLERAYGLTGSPTITVTAPAHNKSWAEGAKMGGERIPNTEDTPPKPLQQRLFAKTAWGIAQTVWRITLIIRITLSS